MLNVLSAIVPVFLIVAVGYLVTRAGVLKRQDMTVLSTYVVRVALPVLVFVNVVGRSLSEILNPVFLLAYGLAAMVLMFGGVLFSRARGGAGVRAATVGFASSGTNNGFMGFPILLLLLPETAGLSVGMSMLVDNTLIVPVALALYEAASGRGGSPLRRASRVALNVVRHPMVIAITLALLVEAFGIELPGVVERSVTMVANSSSAVALFSIGGMLVGLRLKGQLTDLFAAVTGKLVVMPAIAVGLVILLPMLGLPALTWELRAAVILTCALPSMTVMAALAEQHGEGELGAAAMMLSTVCSFFTMTAWLLGLTAVGWL